MPYCWGGKMVFDSLDYMLKKACLLLEMLVVKPVAIKKIVPAYNTAGIVLWIYY
ncbi:MAG: hypothetical protein U0T81_08875 [Saprospiraceae bacterium]